MAFPIAEITEPITADEWLIVLLGVTVSGSVAVASGALRPRSIDGPARLPVMASSFNLWLTIFAAISGQILLSGLVLEPLIGPIKTPMTPHQTTVIYPVSSLCGLIALLLAHRLQTPRWRMSRSPRLAIVPALLGTCVAIPLIFSASILTQELLHVLRLQTQESHALIVAFEETASKFDRWLVVISAVIIAPVYEEMLFRAQLQTAIRQLTRRPWAAVLIASTLFGLAHGSAWMFASLFLLALVLGYIYERTANLYATVFIHGLFNAIMLSLARYTLSHP